MNDNKVSTDRVYLRLVIMLVTASVILLAIVIGFDRVVNYGLLLVIVPVSYITGLIYGRSKQPNQLITVFSAKHNYSIYRTFIDVFRRNVGEVIMITLIGIICLLCFAFYLEGYSKINPTSLAPTTIGILLSFASVIITIVGMFYAFLAERRAHESENMSRDSLKESKKLLEEKGDFIEHFSGFINRINRKLAPEHNGIISDICNSDEEYFYEIKCMFLTPFLGHAGITSSNRELHRSLNRFQSHMNELIESTFCDVKILSLDSKPLVKWYAQIQWIEEVKKKLNYIMTRDNNYDATFLDLTENDKMEVITNVKKTLESEKGLGVLKMDDGKSEIKSFSTIKEHYKANYSGTKAGSPKLKIYHTDYIPFQLFLVMKRKKNTNADPEGKFVVLTFVGDKTYYELIKDMSKGEHPRNGGIDDLLTNLHSAFYSEDPRICKILNNHFEHYWEASEHNKHYPDVDDELWKDCSIYKEKDCLPEECLPANF